MPHDWGQISILWLGLPFGIIFAIVGSLCYRQGNEVRREQEEAARQPRRSRQAEASSITPAAQAADMDALAAELDVHPLVGTLL